MSTASVSTIPDPKAPHPTTRRGGQNWELAGWVFMRASGVILLVLIFGHLFVNLLTGEGVHQIDFAFVAGKWSEPFWRVWDLLMLWLAMIHGTNGVRTIINDYSERDQTRFWLKAALLTATVFTIALGTLVIFTFDPNIS